ncbi:MAG: hypothetical protein CMJ94_15650 [Planctomycetes bacterium]|nr:hypothetical protein [Planctomycetota bacterium]
MSTPKLPTLVVVGHVNKGKSSVVASLTEDASVPIDRTPGTTARSGSYALMHEGQPVLRVIDTPGFQEAAAALAWLRARASDASERQEAVRAFVEHFGGAAPRRLGEPDFEDEVELLRPLVEGEAGVLYVVDASRPYRPVHEAEMEILRWAGQPGIALLNRIGPQDHAGSWRPVLTQFFNAVHEFDAHQAGLDARLRLLEVLGAVRSDWRPAAETAIAHLREQRARRDRQATETLAEGIGVLLRHVERKPAPPHGDSVGTDVELAADYQDALRKLEAGLRRDLAELYGHPADALAPSTLELLSEDLFSETSWRVFGLTRQQLTLYAAGWGALLGGGLDLAVGGLSLGTGMLLGGLLGGAGAWFGGARIGKAWDSQSALFRRMFPGETGHFRLIGPVAQPRLAWLLLDRALTHARAIRALSHARSAQGPSTPSAQGKQGVAAQLDKPQRDALDRGLRAVLQAAQKGRPLAEDEERAWQQALHAALTAD